MRTEVKWAWMLLMSAVVMATLVSGCKKKPKPVIVEETSAPVSFQRDVAPILTARCTVCHSCYDAPCQLNLGSFQGVSRGASKIRVYDSSRLSAIPPTRLFLDAFSTDEWRKKGFYSVTSNSTLKTGENNSIFLELLNLKRKNAEPRGDYYSEPGQYACVGSSSELAAFMDSHPERGMPFGFPAISDAEFQTLSQWVAEGAQGPTLGEERERSTPSPQAQKSIQELEDFFNTDNAKHKMTARYLFEHLFLAHIHFTEDAEEFFQIVRSKTAAPEPIEIINTPLPYNPPGTAKFYYRFRKITSTIVHKTHIVFTLDDQELKRIQELFIKPKWISTPHVMPYDPAVSPNPFRVYEQIPPKSRYQFLLDHSDYMLMTFIRGPVCKGNIALDVIQDHFWVMFMDPQFDVSVLDPKYLSSQIQNLRMPTMTGVDPSLADLVDYPYDNFAIAYYEARQWQYKKRFPKGLGYSAIWPGRTAGDAPLQTIYRHYNSATVRKGVLGNLPRTLWVIDYPVFERIYYDLVAGFDVYSDVTSQLNIRRYMDRLRIEGETNFLDFMPKKDRRPMFSSWYDVPRGGRELVRYTPTAMPTAIQFKTDDPKREMVTHVVEKVVLPSTNIHFDPINYFTEGEPPPPMPKSFRTKADFIRGIRAIQRPGLKFLEEVDGGNANLAFIRLRMADGTEHAYTFVVNRFHTNVAFMFFEKNRLVPSKDSFNVIPGFLGTYPDFIFDVAVEDLAGFFQLLMDFQKDQTDLSRLFRYGVARSDPKFWEKFDWFQAKFMKEEPVRGGLFDLTEYYYKSFK